MVGSRGFEPRIASAPGWYPCPLKKHLALGYTHFPSTADTLTRRRPHTTKTRYENLIINTLLKAQSKGLTQNTLKSISYSLKQISKTADLNNPEEVKMCIANMNVANSTKQKHINNYAYYCTANEIEWNRPSYKWDRKIPLIPTTANIDKIISASTRKYATIFTILKETGLEGHELATTTRQHIDSEQGIISAQGCKGHNSRAIKLKQKTADMLRRYLHKYTGNKPFPNSRAMGEAWRRKRDKLAETLQEPQLKTIPLRNLRHYHATMLYDRTKDILLVKQRLGHKKLETTMFYTQLITFNENEEYTCKTATNTKEATKLIEAGFTYVAEKDEIMLFRKRK